MPVETVNETPTVIEAGNTIRFTEGFSDFPASDRWTAKAIIVADTPVASDGTADGDEFEFVFTGSQTGSITPGKYLLAIYATKDGERTKAKVQPIRVLPNLEAVPIPSSAERMLKELDSVMEALASDADFTSVSFNGQSFTKGGDHTQLRAWRVALQAEVIRERDELAAAHGICRDGRIDIVFAEAGVR
jgi:hypothetical protein